MKKEVNPDLYNRQYYLTDNEGYKEYEKSFQIYIHPKFIRALTIANPAKGDNVLDIGCGRGELIYYCAKKGANAFGIDYSKAAVEITQETLRKLPAELQRLAKAEIADVVTYNFNEKYDIVFMADILEHMYDWQIESAFRKIKEILNDNGRLIISTPNYYYDKYLFYIKRIINIPFNIPKISLRVLKGKYKPRSFNEFLRKIFRIKVQRDSIQTMHINVLTPSKLKRLLSGFDADIRCQDPSRNPVSLITGKWWGREIIAVAKKQLEEISSSSK
ncbi:MAG: class I SAM-dependent methyltransferase [Candidatus Omnitrophota bacterium]